jgi:hypothetical protein
MWDFWCNERWAMADILKLAATALLLAASSVPAIAAEPAAQPPAKATAGGKPSVATKKKEAKFQPPFPQRQELFIPPAPKADAPKRHEVLADVALKGFANVGGLRALIQIGGKTVPLAAGQTLGEITVVSIEPPQVTLQRGRLRWTESLAPKTPSTATGD